MRLVDADALIKRGDEKAREMFTLGSWYEHYIHGMLAFSDIINTAPTVATEPIVRCKDCKHRPIYDLYERYDLRSVRDPKYDDGNPWGYEGDWTCPFLVKDDDFYNKMPDDDDYCSRGEQKTEVEE